MMNLAAVVDTKAIEDAPPSVENRCFNHDAAANDGLTATIGSSAPTLIRVPRYVADSPERCPD
jgi:hypothetical protein